MRRLYKLPSLTHNRIVNNIGHSLEIILDRRMFKFLHSAINNANNVVRHVFAYRLKSGMSTLAENYRLLSAKYNLTDKHWLDSECKVGLGRIMFHGSKISDEDRCLIASIRELYRLRDGVMYCDLGQHEVRQMLNNLCVM